MKFSSYEFCWKYEYKCVHTVKFYSSHWNLKLNTNSDLLSNCMRTFFFFYISDQRQKTLTEQNIGKKKHLWNWDHLYIIYDKYIRYFTVRQVLDANSELCFINDYLMWNLTSNYCYSFLLTLDTYESSWEETIQ